MEVTLDNINKFGFIFHVYDHKTILKDTDEESLSSLELYIDSLIKIPSENLYSDIDMIEPGGSIKIHFHVIPGSFQVVVWRPEEPFKGREFIYGTLKELRSIRPFKGLMCFMKTNDSSFVHGVAKLLSDKPIKSYGFSSSVCELPEKNDIYIKSDQT